MPPNEEPETLPSLRRSLGLFEVTISGVGLILGAGIYVLIGPASGLAGNALWLAFLLSAVVALFTGLSYAELSSMFPKAGAEYDYVRRAFFPGLAFVIGWLILFPGVLAAAAVALGFAGYFFALTGSPPLISASILIVLLTITLAMGVKETAWVAIVSTVIEILGLFIVIWIGIPFLGSVNYFELPRAFPGLFAASALIFFAYQGFESMVKFSEETRDPQTTIPRALILSLVISVILYVLVALSVISVMGWERLSGVTGTVCRPAPGDAWPRRRSGNCSYRSFCNGKHFAHVDVCLIAYPLRHVRVINSCIPARVDSPAYADPVGSHPDLWGPVAYLYLRRRYRVHRRGHEFYALCNLYRHQRRGDSAQVSFPGRYPARSGYRSLSAGCPSFRLPASYPAYSCLLQDRTVIALGAGLTLAGALMYASSAEPPRDADFY